jgi:transposase-like protein
LLRGFQFTHEAVRDWEARFAPLLAEQLRRRRKGKVGCRWYVDETYLKVKGKWSYLYRAIDGAGNLVDSLLSPTRDMAAPQRFFRGALSVIDKDPLQITTDGHSSYPRAIHEVLGPNVKHRCNAYLNRRIEQTIADSSSAITRCWALAHFPAPAASAEHLKGQTVLSTAAQEKTIRIACHTPGPVHFQSADIGLPFQSA